MTRLRLVIGNKSYSSWSLRPWLAMAQARIVFDEILIPLDQPKTREAILAHSPSGRVPCLIDGDARIWESLAILERLAERFPSAGIWPADPGARALARSISAEMHAGFMALRSECPMNLRRAIPGRPLSAAALADVARIETLWRDARARFGGGGPFLFGSFCAADAMYAPVAARFDTYALPIAADTRAYANAILALPTFQAWKEAALAEPWIVAADEVG